ncbi:MAG: GGDEF domain-containing protein [Schwartzia sp.]|nr:GGDEF domain-containing protein [Schwartzia sp. (in: firmicutes)]
MKKLFCALFALLLAICSCPPPVHAEDVGGSGRLVRVGLVEPPGLQEKFAYQMLLNQLKGYLSEVSKHKRWQYVYDSGSYQECVERLRRGELDFVGPVSPGITTAGMIFVGGVPNWTLLNWYRVDDTPRPSLLSQSAKNVTVGFVVNDLTQSAISFFMEKNDWHANVRPFFDGPSMIAALRRGEIDAVCDNGSHAEPGMFSERSFAVVPARLMTTPDKQWLCDELTDAVLTIEAVNPSFGTSLKGKYVDRALQTIARPTKTAERFVESAKELRVAVLPDFAPFFELREDGTAQGLYMDILRLLSESSGLKFSLRRAESEPQLWQMLVSGEADMAFVSYADEISVVDVYYTGDVREEKFSVIRRKDGNVQPSGKNVAVIPVGFPGAEQSLAKRYHQRIRTANSVEECLDRVEAGIYETAYIPALYLRRESTMFYRPALQEADRETAELPIALALSPRQPTVLQVILNGSILRLDKNDVERLAYEYGRPTLSVAYLLEQYPLRIALFVGCMVAGLAGLCFVLSRNRLQRKQNEILQQKNRDLEIALSRVEAMRISRDSYKQESETDRLTELYNKMGFENAVRKRLEAMPEGSGGAFFIIDMDHFKEANDTYGHQCGDLILKKFSAVLKEIFRQSDCLGRFGGDEFVVFAEGGLTRASAAQKAKQVVDAAHSITVAGADLQVTASVGIAMCQESGSNYDFLFSAADRALYQVKTEGRDGYSVASSGVFR